MKTLNQFAILVALVSIGGVVGRVPGNGAFSSQTSNSTTMPVLKKSPRVFVNTSVPFSVAPQPVKDTSEVAHVKQQFMKTFKRIQDAVTAAGTEHLNVTLLNNDLTNNLDDTPTPSVKAKSSFAKRGPFIEAAPSPTVLTSIFPDHLTEPEYFLPSQYVDPLLLNQLNPPLPPNPYIQEIRPISDPGLVGTCYEIILLEPEADFFHIPRGNVSNGQNGLTFPSHGSLLDAIAPKIQGRTRSNAKSSPASQVIPIGTPALPGASARKPLSHFKQPELSFLSLLNTGAPLPSGR